MKKRKKAPLKCHFCSNKPTHAVMLELREKQGPPLKSNNVIHVVCDIHAVDNSFDAWVPIWAFRKIAIDYKQQGINIDRKYCNINIVKFK